MVNKYDGLARRYDTRWSFYLRESIRHALAQAAVQPGQTVLDVGCGTGLLLSQIAVVGTWRIGVDPSRGMLAVAQRLRGVRLVQGVAEQLPIASGSVDWLLTSSVFHYIADPFAARREFRRVLRPGGTLVLTDWCADFLTTRLQARWSKATDASFRRIYTSLELQAILVAGGFNVQVERYKINSYWGLITARAVKS